MKKRFFIIGLLIITSICIIGFISQSNSLKKPLYKKISLQQYKDKIKSNDEFVIYIYKTSCPGCEQMKPIVNKIIKEENINLIAMNVEEDKNLDISFLKEQKINKTPIWLHYKNGKEIERLEEVQSETTLKKFIKYN
ncbi:thioredoxin family protein [Bacillus pseudomycoides]|uniref:thioredoxin family protein n=1 Tax=Bacillus pseudomycoides TaxID=64104 RepID=UPI000BECBB71|nr:thioredoxin family protein [Bacillus pseudomycoides]PDY44655.1 thiol reductase thioredoxin [Bacillus pseudomycoides]PGD90924.1 thiol reductase thioredoxin [Bacillus pseudomycoides]PHB44408.1 thiol reductase thioredoxin [Bacillus pseudomycoides]PHE65712.1 thiol reductase thioredoxin [Bacillus pseudomycoides]